MARCPECAGKMTYNPNTKSMVCNSCGLSLTRHELDSYWRKIKDQNLSDLDEVQKKRNRRKDWLEWYSKSKDEK
ncbi:MAG: hypothetical protein GF317_24725 [Candidatus Lokiarchaeota archaeon]|nr:hypothetical protein [Candidatus Lokiarchaeota archaeon]MBD3202566.1 hypothetical protein [Candidatus Lokiarchaeota archaeon]